MTAANRRGLEARIAGAALAGHATLLIASGVAFATFLVPPLPTWMATATNQQVAAIMFSFGGETTVVLGAVAALLHAASRLGWRHAAALFGAAFSLSLTAELIGTTTGYPFGPYSYTTQLGYLVAGRVPFNIPTSWFFMLYASLAICGRVLRVDDSPRGKWRWAVLAALVLTAWDVSMDPAMVATTHWLWHLPDISGHAIAQRVFLSDAFYGMPVTNWLGWLFTGCIIARVMLVIVPPSRWAAAVSVSSLPIVLYAVNGIFPILICVGRGLWGAVVLGSVAMMYPVYRAVRASRRGHASVSRDVPMAAT